jgi:hypothetical protein
MDGTSILVEELCLGFEICVTVMPVSFCLQTPNPIVSTQLGMSLLLMYPQAGFWQYSTLDDRGGPVHHSDLLKFDRKKHPSLQQSCAEPCTRVQSLQFTMEFWKCTEIVWSRYIGSQKHNKHSLVFRPEIWKGRAEEGTIGERQG